MKKKCKNNRPIEISGTIKGFLRKGAPQEYVRVVPESRMKELEGMERELQFSKTATPIKDLQWLDRVPRVPNGSRVKFHYDIPFNETYQKVVAAVESQQHLLPPWLQEMDVKYDDKDGGNRCTIRVSYAYRSATLYIHPLWLDGDEERRAAEIRHEFIHCTIEPLTRICDQLVAFIPEDQRRLLADVVKDRMEATVCDLVAVTKR